MDRHIVPVEPASGRGELVVIEVQQQGVHELDVRLVGCEGENPYVVQIKQSQLPKLKHKFKGTNKDWEAVLAHFLLQKQPGPDQTNLLEGVRMVYNLKKGGLEVSIRQDVQGIKVTWGEIVLPRDDAFELSPFEWAQASAQAHMKTLQELAEVKARIAREKDTITKLNSQLDDFIKTKNESETAMLQQFLELLNEKKRKIRDQTRLLATAKVDKSTALAMQSARTETPRKAGPSRTSKRKTPTRAAKTVQGDSDSDQREVHEAKIEEQNDDEDVPGPATPDRSDAETESEAEASDSGLRDGSSETLKSTSTVAQPTKEAAPSQSSDGPPPPRNLPFGRVGTRSKGPAQKPLSPPIADDDDDETDEEEL
ncbi:hypothetical protein E8E12_006687 [Didymella heteroderae]|uniref:Uncharacterized protein n=1 Tax=Didymella heteroderae TaxID=1769908 RepID=A0A9P5C310_9PLEO|nr:hypothetical protein E8E12_006687 [Didymella heteroderae]